MKARMPQGIGGGPSNMNDLVRQAQKMQAEMEITQNELKTKEYSVSTGGGAVSITMNGAREVLSLQINPEVVDPDDVELLQDMLIGAVNEVLRKVETDSQEAISAVTGNSGSMIPGLF